MDVFGGRVGNRLHLLEQATGDLFGGWVNALYLENANNANIFSGAYVNTYISTRGTSVLNIYGGRMPDRWLNAIDNSRVNLYVRSFNYLPAGDGRITGFWADNTFFGLDLNGSETYSHINIQIVPEPSTLALLGIGTVGIAGFVWRRRGR